MKKIDLVIPCYNTHKTLYRLFGSILSQTIKDEIQIILVDDCSNETYDDIVEKFSSLLDVNIVRLEQNGGPGIARRVGMQAGTSPYIMFIDSDDTFFNAFSIEHLLYAIENKKCDIVYSNFIEDMGNGSFVPHINDQIWVFGKIYSRKFLENYGIYFNDTRSNEDNGFNTLTRCFTSPEFLDEITYVWHYNPKSITRINNALYSYTCTEGQVFNKIWAFQEGYKKGWSREYYLKNILGQFCFYYFNYFNIKSQTREEIDINEYVKWIANYYKTFKEEIGECLDKGYLSEAYRLNFINYFNDFDNIKVMDLTIDEFIDLLNKV